jgi:membrane associated rhomboid family serine protease
MMIIPLRTNAPLYHYPWVTLCLIAANIASFVATGYGEQHNDWLLEYGNGLHPTQWVLCNFLHFGFMHLLGNMIFLWAFGLVVEGKLGWWRYLAVYFGIGIVHASIVQLGMLGYTTPSGGAGGASAVIFGLMAISMVWAPKNEVTCLWLVGMPMSMFRLITFEITILTLSLFYLAWQLVFAWLSGFHISSEVCHLLGAAIGFGIGVWMFKKKWVDCENWDLFAVLKGTHGNSDDFAPYLHRHEAWRIQHQTERKNPLETTDAEDAPKPNEPQKLDTQARGLATVQRHLKNGSPALALHEFHDIRKRFPNWELSESDLDRLANDLYKAKAFDKATPLMEEFIERFPHQADRMRLRLAAVAVEVQKRPQFALRILDRVKSQQLSDSGLRRLERVRLAAEKLVDEGVIELDGQAWG